MNRYYNEKEAHRFVWYGGRVWKDSGLRDVYGRILLNSVRDRSEGATVDPSRVRPVEGAALEACRKMWGAP